VTFVCLFILGACREFGTKSTKIPEWSVTVFWLPRRKTRR